MTAVLRHPTANRIATDEELVALARAGDDRAVHAIHARDAPRLVAFARGLLGGTHHDAEDVVQDAFVRALAALRARRPAHRAAGVAARDRPPPGRRRAAPATAHDRPRAAGHRPA